MTKQKTKKTKKTVTVEAISPTEFSMATKEYIAAHFNKLSTQEIATNTGLTEQQILNYVHNVEREVKAPRKKGKYGAVKGETTIMDEGKSARGDQLMRNMPKPDLSKMYGKDVVTIEFKDGYNED